MSWTPLQTVDRDFYATRRAPREVKPRHAEQPIRPVVTALPEPPATLREKQQSMRGRIQRRRLEREKRRAATYRPLRAIISRVATHYQIEERDLREGWGRLYSRPRQLAMYLARKLTPASLQQIGSAMARGRHHTTVNHAVLAIEKRRQADAGFNQLVSRLEGQLRLTLEGEGQDGWHVIDPIYSIAEPYGEPLARKPVGAAGM